MKPNKLSKSIAILNNILSLLEQDVSQTKQDTSYVNLEMYKELSWLQQSIEKLQGGISHVVVTGNYNVGKSTLINALLGKEILPMGAVPTTALVSNIVFGEELSAYSINVSGNKTKLSWSDFSNNFSLNSIETSKKINIQDITSLEISIPSSVIKEGVKIVDTPGLGEHKQRTKLALDYLPNAGAIVMVLNANQALNKIEKQFIRLLGIPPLSNVFFVVNRIDLIKEKERSQVIDYVQDKLKPYFTNKNKEFDQKLYSARVFYTDADGALENKMEGKILRLSFDFFNFEKELAKSLKAETQLKNSLRSILNELIYLVYKAKRKVETKSIILKQPLSILEEKYQISQSEFTKLNKTANNIAVHYADAGDVIKQQVYGSLLVFIDEMKRDWKQDVESFELKELEDLSILGIKFKEKEKEKLASTIAKELNDYLEIKLVRWATSLSNIIHNSLEGLAEDLSKKLEKFTYDLDLITRSFVDSDKKNNSSLQEDTAISQGIVSRIVQDDTFILNISDSIKISTFDHLKIIFSNPKNLATLSKGAISGILAFGTMAMRSNPITAALFAVGGTLLEDFRQKMVSKADTNSESGGISENDAKNLSKNEKQALRAVVRQALADELGVLFFKKVNQQILYQKDTIENLIEKEFKKSGDFIKKNLKNSVNTSEQELRKIIEKRKEKEEAIQKNIAQLNQVVRLIKEQFDNYCMINLEYVMSDDQINVTASHRHDYSEMLKSEEIPDENDKKVNKEIEGEKDLSNHKDTQDIESLERGLLSKLQTSLRKGLGLPEVAETVLTGINSKLPSLELAQMIGLKSVKEAIIKFENYQKEQIKRKKIGKKVSTKTSLHLAFLGNPGTGKTTVAEAVGMIYKRIGLLKKGHVVTVTRKELIAGYVGHTAPQTRKWIEKALDGVLFIDEAYSLSEKKGQESNDFGKEAIVELLQGMVDYKDRLAVIVAGYPEPMKNFLESNPGLKGRFPEYNRINFPNYSASELLEILKLSLADADFYLTEETKEIVKEILEGMCINAEVDTTFSNARAMRDFSDYLQKQRSVRISNKQQDSEDDRILPEDIGEKYLFYRQLNKLNNIKGDKKNSIPSEKIESKKFNSLTEERANQQSRTQQNSSGGGDNILGNKIIYASGKDKVEQNLTLIPYPRGKKIFVSKATLGEIQNIVSENNIALLHGIAGSGKTSTALKFVQEYQQDYQHVAWLRCEDTFSSAFLESPELLSNLKLSFDESMNEHTRFRLLLDKLNTLKTNTLLVIENVHHKHEKEIRELPLSSHFKILLTSKEVLKNIPVIKIELSDFSIAKSIFFQGLNKREANISDETLENIFQHVGFHPLAIELSARTLAEQKHISGNKFVQNIKEKGWTVTTGNQNNKDNINELFSGLVNVSGLEEEEKKVLRYFSVLPATEVRYKDLTKLFKLEKQVLNQTLSSLLGKGYIQEDENNGYRCPQIIQEVCLNKLNPTIENCSILLQSLGSDLSEIYDFDNSREIVLVAPRILKILQNVVKHLEQKTILFADIYQNLGIFARILGDFDAATKWHKKDIDIKSGHLKDTPFICIYAFLEYSDTLIASGDYNEAKQILRDNLNNIQKYAPDAKQELGMTYEQIGMLLIQQGQIAEAINNLEKAILEYSSVDNIEPHRQAITANNIGLAFLKIGNIPEAKTKFEEAREYFERSDSAEHKFGFASTYLYLSLVWLGVQDLDKAKYYIRVAEEKFTEILKKDDYVFSTLYNNSALIDYRKIVHNTTTRSIEKEEVEILKSAVLTQKKAIDILDIYRPSNHPDFSTYYFNLSGMYRVLGEKEEAKLWHSKCLSVLEKPNTKDFQLANLYFLTVVEFENIFTTKEYIRFLEKAIEVLPEKQEYNLNKALYYLCLAERETELVNHTKALLYNQKAYELYLQNTEDDNLIRAFCLQQIANDYRHLGDNDKSLENQEKVIAMCEKGMHPDDSDLAIPYTNMALLQFNYKNYENALFFKQKAIKISAQTQDNSDLNKIGKLGLVKTVNGKFAHVIISTDSEGSVNVDKNTNPVQLKTLKIYSSSDEVLQQQDAMYKKYGEAIKLL